MRTEKDVEAYLLRQGRRFEPTETAGDSVASGKAATYLVQTSTDMPPVALRVDPPLVVLRVHIGDLGPPASGSPGGKEALFRRLLELNAGALVHAAYGLDGDRIVLTCALELENLDFNELQAALDEVELALAQQVPGLAEISKKAS